MKVGAQSGLATQMLRQAMQQQQQMAEQMIQISLAQQSVQNGQQIAGVGALVDGYA